jgi:hypothetical protein
MCAFIGWIVSFCQAHSGRPSQKSVSTMAPLHTISVFLYTPAGCFMTHLKQSIRNFSLSWVVLQAEPRLMPRYSSVVQGTLIDQILNLNTCYRRWAPITGFISSTRPPSCEYFSPFVNFPHGPAAIAILNLCHSSVNATSFHTF